MNNVFSSHLVKGGLCVFLAVVVCGCSLMAKKQEEYVAARAMPPLKVPAGLTAPPAAHETHIPAASGAKTPKPAQPKLDTPPIVALESSDIQLRRDGSLNWLVIRESEDDAWRQTRDFWERDGIALAYENARLGIMETAWRTQGAAETTGPAATPGAVVQRMFRVRLEHYADTGGTEVFISSRGRKQESAGAGVQWVPLPANAVLEADMMNRLLVFLGGDPAGTQRVAAQAPRRGIVKRVEEGGQPSLRVDRPLEMAWRHVGQALDRLGYAIVAQDRAAHKFMITLGGHPPAVVKKAGWLSRLFFSNKENRPAVPVYSVDLASGKGSGTVVTADIDPGTGADPGQDRKILDQIYGELR
jgi:outer membrane protein assembly factor BamC